MYGTRMRMKYKDDDGDMVSIRSEQDLMTLLKGSRSALPRSLDIQL
jgi:hypothetical protein